MFYAIIIAIGRHNSWKRKLLAFQQLAYLGGCILFGCYMGGSPELLHSKHNHQFGPFLKGLQLQLMHCKYVAMQLLQRCCWHVCLACLKGLLGNELNNPTLVIVTAMFPSNLGSLWLVLWFISQFNTKSILDFWLFLSRKGFTNFHDCTGRRLFRKKGLNKNLVRPCGEFQVRFHPFHVQNSFRFHRFQGMIASLGEIFILA